MRRGLLNRVLSVVRSFAARLMPARIHSAACEAGRSRDVLWRAKCNAFRRALLDHHLTEAEACRILVSLLTRKPRGCNPRSGRGCELARLSSLSGLSPRVLDQAIPLMGLQGFITVEQRSVGGDLGTVLWVSATEHGARYAGESGLSFVQGPANATTEARIESHAPGITKGGGDA